MALVTNSLDSLSLESVGMNWKDWPYQFFLTGEPFTISFAIAYTGVVTLGRNISVLCSYWSYCGQEYTQGRAQALR